LPVSTREWIPSEIIAELPVIVAATNLVMAIRELPASAAKMTFLLPLAMVP
jgi:hypothetical protein